MTESLRSGKARTAPSASDTSPTVLEFDDVHASYGPFRALFGVSLRVGVGGALALLGANGAGKTTVARVASGLVKPTSGTVSVGGDDFTGRRAYRFARAGVTHAPEGRSVLSTLTVEENLRLSFRKSLGKAGVEDGLDRAYDIFPTLGVRRAQMAGTLSGGEQRMLSLSRSLVESPKLLIADELSLGLAPIIIDHVYELLAQIRESGTALLIVEQLVGPALALCDDVAIMTHGSVSWTGPADEAAEIVTTQLFEPGAS
jgi:branched-chain amino acid transport system ATP-binding protein